MKSRPFLLTTFILCIVVSGCEASPASQASQTSQAHQAAETSQPTQDWMQYASAADAGFNSETLSEVGALADSVDSASLMVVFKGNVLASWGDVQQKYELHSVRKSLVSALFGTRIHEGSVSLNTTLGELGINDKTPLTEAEKQATIQNLISARSGIYLPSAYSPADMDENRPERGAHAPGTRWFYNNWDFNVSGVILEQISGDNLYHTLYKEIAQPIGMQDFTVSDGFKVREPSASIHPAQTMRMSTRDLARFGQLMLNEGSWNGTQIIPSSWVRESTSTISDLGDSSGYGYMWWTYEPGFRSDILPHLSRYHAYLGRGTGGQMVMVIPDLELIIVHRVDTYRGNNVSGMFPLRMADMIVEAHQSSSKNNPALKPMESLPLRTQHPTFEWPQTVHLTASQLDQYAGQYQIERGPTVSLYVHEDGLFGFFPGQGEAELFASSTETFFLRIDSNISMTFSEFENGSPNALGINFGGQKMKAKRVEKE